MVKVATMIRLKAQPGKAAEVESFLHDQLAFAQGEPATIAWFALRLGPDTFAIFDAFPDDSGRKDHLSGVIATELKEITPRLLAEPPSFERIDILAAKLPDSSDTPDSLG